MLKTILCGRGNGPTRHRPDAPPVPSTGPGGYDGLIIDLDGVVWRGGDPIPGAAEAIAAVRGSGIRVMFVTNEPRRSRAALAQRLTEIGIPATVADVRTSAAVAAAVAGSLPRLVDRRALVVGPPALHDEIKGAGLQLVACEQAREAEVVVAGGHEGFVSCLSGAGPSRPHRQARPPEQAQGRDQLTPSGPRVQAGGKTFHVHPSEQPVDVDPVQQPIDVDPVQHGVQIDRFSSALTSSAETASSTAGSAAAWASASTREPSRPPSERRRADGFTGEVSLRYRPTCQA